MRTPVIAGNWKMNLDRTAALALVRELREKIADRSLEVGVAPSYPYLEAVGSALRGSGIFLAGQNLHSEKFGAFTGEVSGAMLKEVGCSHVIVGHSERRQLFGETSKLVGEKVRSALRQGLVPILCVGETLSQRKDNQTHLVVLDQMECGLEGLSEKEAAAVLVAYEPVWAIGTGVNATPAQAHEVHRLIRDWLRTRFSPSFSEATRILYGGSVKADNAAELLSVEDVDGALVGTASLTAASFLGIVAACPKAASKTVRH